MHHAGLTFGMGHKDCTLHWHRAMHPMHRTRSAEAPDGIDFVLRTVHLGPPAALVSLFLRAVDPKGGDWVTIKRDQRVTMERPICLQGGGTFGVGMISWENFSFQEGGEIFLWRN